MKCFKYNINEGGNELFLRLTTSVVFKYLNFCCEIMKKRSHVTTPHGACRTQLAVLQQANLKGRLGTQRYLRCDLPRFLMLGGCMLFFLKY